MCHSRTLNCKINRIQEQTSRIVYNDYKSNFKELLERDHTLTIHERNVQCLAIEAYKVKNGLSPVTMNAFQFVKNSAYELKSGNNLQRTNIQTVHFGSESIKILGIKIWNLIPAEIKALKSLMIFKKKIKNRTPKSCPCRLCRFYTGQGSILCQVSPHLLKQNILYIHTYFTFYIYCKNL